jgi:hypothetical protein
LEEEFILLKASDINGDKTGLLLYKDKHLKGHISLLFNFHVSVPRPFKIFELANKTMFFNKKKLCKIFAANL